MQLFHSKRSPALKSHWNAKDGRIWSSSLHQAGRRHLGLLTDSPQPQGTGAALRLRVPHTKEACPSFSLWSVNYSWKWMGNGTQRLYNLAFLRESMDSFANYASCHPRSSYLWGRKGPLSLGFLIPLCVFTHTQTHTCTQCVYVNASTCVSWCTHMGIGDFRESVPFFHCEQPSGVGCGGEVGGLFTCWAAAPAGFLASNREKTTQETSLHIAPYTSKFP